MKCPRCGFNDDPVNEPEYSDDVCQACDEEDQAEDGEQLGDMLVFLRSGADYDDDDSILGEDDEHADREEP